MATDSQAQPSITIIKRKKVVKGDGHHGGAWKVAYADFVTAMMAFFLLMWLLNATTEDQRKGLADYFNPSIPISRISGGGSGALNGSSIYTEERLTQQGTGGARETSVEVPENKMSEAEIEARLADLKKGMMAENDQMSEHIEIKMSPEGIVLELIDTQADSLFAVGVSEPTPLLGSLLKSVGQTFGGFGNDIKVVGHTDNSQFSSKGRYDNWSLSADRANAARRILIGQGFDAARIREVSGKADTVPLIEDDPSAPQNRRVSIIILT